MTSKALDRFIPLERLTRNPVIRLALSRSRKLFVELKQLAREGLPLVITFAGNTLLGVVDTAMVGRLGAEQLAGVALGGAVFFTFTVAAMGFVFGIDPIISQAVGAGEGRRARAALRTGLSVGLLASVPAMLILLLAPLSFGAIGIDSLTAGYARDFLWARTPGVIPFLLVIAQRAYLQGRAYASPLVWGTVLANVINFIANSWFIFGGLGVPAMGVVGSAIASNLSSLVQFLLIWIVIRRLAVGNGGGNPVVPARLVAKIGAPIALTLMAEVGAFSIVGIFAARIGPAAASGHQVAITLASLTFTVALGLSSATGVRVGQAIGRNDSVAARRAGFAGLLASLLYMSMTAVGFLLLAPVLARAMSDRPSVIAATIPLLHIAAAFQLFDGAQVVAAGALRGLGDTKYVQYANLGGYYVVGLPISLVLAFVFGMDERGLWWGLCVGLALVSVLLIRKFELISRGPVARLG